MEVFYIFSFSIFPPFDWKKTDKYFPSLVIFPMFFTIRTGWFSCLVSFAGLTGKKVSKTFEAFYTWLSLFLMLCFQRRNHFVSLSFRSTVPWKGGKVAADPLTLHHSCSKCCCRVLTSSSITLTYQKVNLNQHGNFEIMYKNDSGFDIDLRNIHWQVKSCLGKTLLFRATKVFLRINKTKTDLLLKSVQFGWTAIRFL